MARRRTLTLAAGSTPPRSQRLRWICLASFTAIETSQRHSLSVHACLVAGAMAPIARRQRLTSSLPFPVDAPRERDVPARGSGRGTGAQDAVRRSRRPRPLQPVSATLDRHFVGGAPVSGSLRARQHLSVGRATVPDAELLRCESDPGGLRVRRSRRDRARHPCDQLRAVVSLASSARKHRRWSRGSRVQAAVTTVWSSSCSRSSVAQ